MLGKLNTRRINSILTNQALGRLACADGENPYVIPVTYAFDGNYIYGQSNEGMKLKILRKNPNVCFEVDIMLNMRNWESVIAFGRFQELKNKTAEKAREILYDRIFALKTSSSVHLFGNTTKSKVNDSSRVKQVMYRIKIEKLTGRFEKE